MNDDAKTILIIEDEDFISGMMAASLKEEGHHVIITSDLKSSLIVLDTEEIDLVISDVMLPFAGGLDVVEYIRSHRAIQRTPVMLVTGMDTDVLKATDVKVDYILPKPFEMIDLVDKVNELLGKKEL